MITIAIRPAVDQTNSPMLTDIPDLTILITYKIRTLRQPGSMHPEVYKELKYILLQQHTCDENCSEDIKTLNKSEYFIKNRPKHSPKHASNIKPGLWLVDVSAYSTS